MKFFMDLLKFTTFFLIGNFLFLGRPLNKALIIAIGAYCGPRLIDYVYNQIKSKLN